MQIRTIARILCICGCSHWQGLSDLLSLRASAGQMLEEASGDNRLPKATPGWVIPGAVKIYSPSMEPGLIVRLKRYIF